MAYQYAWGFHQQKSEKKKHQVQGSESKILQRALETKPTAVQRVFAKGARAEKTSQCGKEIEKVGS
jgi:hypothetical protein